MAHRRKIGKRDPGFFRRCMRAMKGRKGVRDHRGLCAKIHKKVTGIWPGEHKRKK